VYKVTINGTTTIHWQGGSHCSKTALSRFRIGLQH